MAHRLQAVAVMMLAGLSACTTMKQDTPVAQTAAVPSQPSPLAMPPNTGPGTNASSTQPSMGSVEHFIEGAPDRVYFAYDKSDLNNEALSALQRQAAWLGLNPSVVLVIEGHSDERGTREYNLALAARRADAGAHAMIARLTGMLAEKAPDRVVIDVQGVGYAVFVSLQTFAALPAAGATVKILVHTEVREDAIDLIGFVDEHERALFHLLRKVKGLGPRTSLAVLSKL